MELNEVLKKTAKRKKNIRSKRPKASAALKDRPYENDLSVAPPAAEPPESMTTTQLFAGLLKRFASDAYHSLRDEVSGRVENFVARRKRIRPGKR